MQVEMFVIARQSQSINGGISFHKGERVLMEVSRKFLPEQLRPLAYQAGFIFQVILCSFALGCPYIILAFLTALDRERSLHQESLGFDWVF